MTKRIVFATGNPHKLKEINAIASSIGQDVEFILPEGNFNPEENGKTFEENSLIKAKAAYELSKMPVLADDSGLCVEALNGAPGLYSARYAGSQQEKIDKLLKELNGIENRNAKFVCCMTLLNENGEIEKVVTGECEGKIVTRQSGQNGFGYDPVFEVKNTGKTMAELTEEEKNKISHRGNALRKILN
ncbi:RdgB/HAM1 family non-canonical purine NTP pyrophosphatase [bacterium]|nr:RdgB/HAM1 family non-canonical purine NTP pyrophosphatase [bacterium]